MTWFAVYRHADGELVSIGTDVASPLPAPLRKKAIGEGDLAPAGAWDPAAKTWIPAANNAAAPAPDVDDLDDDPDFAALTAGEKRLARVLLRALRRRR